MKLFKNLLLVTILFLGFTAAQSKLAHINRVELLAAMPETTQMEDEVGKVAQAYDADYKSKATALKIRLQKYDQEAVTQTEAENQNVLLKLKS